MQHINKIRSSSEMVLNNPPPHPPPRDESRGTPTTTKRTWKHVYTCELFWFIMSSNFAFLRWVEWNSLWQCNLLYLFEKTISVWCVVLGLSETMVFPFTLIYFLDLLGTLILTSYERCGGCILLVSNLQKRGCICRLASTICLNEFLNF